MPNIIEDRDRLIEGAASEAMLAVAMSLSSPSQVEAVGHLCALEALEVRRPTDAGAKSDHYAVLRTLSDADLKAAAEAYYNAPSSLARGVFRSAAAYLAYIRGTVDGSIRILGRS
jgi:hypothetical protein